MLSVKAAKPKKKKQKRKPMLKFNKTTKMYNIHFELDCDNILKLK